MTSGRLQALATVLAAVAVVAGCTAAHGPTAPSPATETGSIAPDRSVGPSDQPTPNQTFDVIASPTISGAYRVGNDSQALQLECYGHGEAIVFESGSESGDIHAFPDALLRPLAKSRMACLYDRLGLGASDKPTAERRTIDDTAADLDALLTGAKIPPPYVLVGQSLGGNLLIWYAVRHPERVRALVLIDVGFDDPDEIAGLFPGAAAWDNPEHLDMVDGARREASIHMPIGSFPVLIITADNGEASPPPPSGWRKVTSDTREIVKHGGHDLHQEMPEEIAAEIESFLIAH